MRKKVALIVRDPDEIAAANHSASRRDDDVMVVATGGHIDYRARAVHAAKLVGAPEGSRNALKSLHSYYYARAISTDLGSESSD